MIRIFRGVNRNAFVRGEFRNGAEPEVFIGIVFVGEDRGDFKSAFEQCFDAFASDVVVGKHNSFHCNSFLYRYL